MEILTRKAERGVTLVELLAAMAIIGVVALAVMGLYTQSMAMNASGMDYLGATNLARDRLEELMAMPYNAAPLAYSSWGPMLEPVNYVVDTLPPEIGFTRSYEIRELRFEKTQETSAWQEQLSTTVNPGEGNLKLITVVVESNKGSLVGRRGIRVSGMKAQGT